MAARDARYRGLQNALPLFGLFWPPTFAQPHTRAAAVLFDKFDAGWPSSSLADLPEKRDQERQV